MLSAYGYQLPQDRIASTPLSQRDQAKLLCYQGGTITHHVFRTLADLLPPQSMLVYNNTRVVKARLPFRRETGAKIEILLLHPHDPYDIQQAMARTGAGVWQCMVGNKKRWKSHEAIRLDVPHTHPLAEVSAEWVDQADNLIRLQWPAQHSFSALLTRIGQLPLPPYLNRVATAADEQQYQTVYAQHEGAVAAPTAGLHFTDAVLDDLAQGGHTRLDVTLHVGAGTFLPVKTEEITEHDMHAEQLIVFPHQLKQLLAVEGPVIPVGTTSLRFVETLYWLGVSLLEHAESIWQGGRFVLPQDFAFVDRTLPSRKAALEALLAYLSEQPTDHLLGETSIFILPGYPFPMTDGLITNFHMPETTLMLLVAARIGPDWRTVYEAALDEGYRFLSYGDSSLLLP